MLATRSTERAAQGSPPPHGNDDGPFVVLFLCVDHRSRSVLAERAARSAADQLGLRDILFLGVGGHKTRPTPGVDPATAEQLTRLGFEAGPAQPRRLNAHQLATADLVLTFEREHRTEVYQFAPRMLQRCFSLTELAAISRSTPDLLALPRSQRVAAASRLRQLGEAAPDVPPTWRQAAESHHHAATAISTAIVALVDFLS